MIPEINIIKENSLFSTMYPQEIQNLEQDLQQIVNSYGGSISHQQAFELLTPILGRNNPEAAVMIDVARGNITPKQARKIVRVVNSAKQDLRPVPANPPLMTFQRNLEAELAKPVGQPRYVEGRGWVGNTSDFQDPDKIAQYREAVSRHQAIQDKREATRERRLVEIAADLESISSIVPNTILGQTGVISGSNIDISGAKIDPIMRRGAVSIGGTGQGLGRQVESNVINLGGQSQQAQQTQQATQQPEPIATQGMLQGVLPTQPVVSSPVIPAAQQVISRPVSQTTQPVSQMASIDPVQMEMQSLFNSLINPQAPRLQNIQQPSLQSYLGGLNTKEYLDLINRIFAQY